ncbi:hypothetical protein GXW82_43445 [Streptacidiphilus sp. 4-A2]|nr:hypothetical protein [Streptacidiphilus sp. 4-A2]
MVWNDQGKIASDTTVSGSTTYLYDTDGNLILRTDPAAPRCSSGTPRSSRR